MSTFTAAPVAPATIPASFSQPADFYQTRDFGQKWEATAQLLRQHGRVFIATLLRYTGPWFVLALIIEAASYATGNPAAANLGNIAQRVGVVVGTGITFGFLRLRMHQYQSPGYQLTVADVWNATSGTGSYFGKSLLGNLLTGVACLLLLLPGIYVAVALSLLPAVSFLEEDGSLERCFTLIKGYWWSTLALALVGGLLYVGLLFLPNLLVGYLVRIDFDNQLISLPISFFTTVVTFFLYPTMNVLLAFNYFSIVEARESRGLEWRVQQLGEAAPAPVTTPDSLYAPDDAPAL